MKIWPYFVIMVCILTTSEMAKGEQQGKMSAAINLPSEVAGWRRDKNEVRDTSKALFEYIDGAAELYLAYGFQNLAIHRFQKPNQPPITLEIYEMTSPRMPMESFLLNARMNP